MQVVVCFCLHPKHFMKALLLAASFLMSNLTLETNEPIPSSSFSLSERPLTTNVGILLPSQIIRVEANQEVKMYLPDGTKFTGTITKTQFKTKDHFECFGELNSHSNAGFGFVMTRDGVFAGAVVLRDSDTIFHVSYSEEAKGYVLLKKVMPTIRL